MDITYFFILPSMIRKSYKTLEKVLKFRKIFHESLAFYAMSGFPREQD